jgi:hypothetical protein
LEAQGYVDIGYAWWNFSNTGDTLADASYADFVNPTPNDPGIVDSGFKYGVFVDGADPGWGAYNPNHVYDVNYSGTGKPIQFYYSDDDYGDNSGSMNVLVFELEMNPTPPPPNGGQNPPPNPNPPPPRLPPPPPNSPPPNNSPDEQDTIDVWDQNSPVDPAGDLLNMVTAVIPQAAPPVSLCVPETQYGDAVIDMATQATDTVDYSINGVTASPDNGTVSSAGIAVVLTPTDGTQDFLITLTDEQTDVTAEVDVFVTQPLVNPETVHDTPTGSFLSQSDKTNGSVGADVPIDDGDFNYDGVLDDHEPGDAPPVGDDRLLPIVLKGTGSSAPGDYYSFPSIPSFIKVFQTTNTPTGVALAQVTSTTQLQSQSDQTLYVEGTAQGNDTLNVNFTTNGAAYTNVDYFWITTFEMTGPMDVPGNGTYEYTATGEVNGANTLPSSAFWVSPTGGALDTIIGPDDVTIQWNNPAAGEVGKARFLVNGSYEWDFDVNVVGVTLGTYSVNYGGPPTQESTSNSFIDSGPPGGPSHDTASIDASVTLTGPVAPGSNKMRGVKFIDIGIIQNGQVAQYNALFADQSTLTSSLQGSQTYLDSTYSGPWYNPATPIGKDSTKATLVPHLSLDDFPSGWGVTKTGILLNYNGNPTLNPGYALTNLNLLVNFTDWIAAATVETVNGSAVVPAAQGVSQNEYAGLWETKWYFNGSGSFYIISTSPTFQEGYTTSGKDDGDVTLSPATDPILTTGPILGDVVNSDQNEWR